MLTLLTFILVLGLLIFVHELGHFIAARHVGVRVETFSIGFPPTICGRKIGETEYKLSWIPLGGYVRLFGQNVHDEDPEHPENYASKSLFQRLYILLGGPVMNLLFSLICMPVFFMLGTRTPAYLEETPRIRDIKAGSVVERMGLRQDDLILRINNREVYSWQEVNQGLGEGLASSKLNLSVERKGTLLDLEVPLKQLEQQRQMGWSPYITPRAGGFTTPSPAREAGILEGDLILSINEKPIRDWSELVPVIQESQKADNQAQGHGSRKILVEYERKGSIQFAEIVPYFEPEAGLWLMGMSMHTNKLSHGFLESVRLGTDRILQLTQATFQFLFRMLSGQGSMNDLGGPIRIGMVLGNAAKTGISDLLFLMAFISLQLGIFNLLPIPALDGGHILLLGLEKLKGGPLSSVFRERTQMFGFSVLIALMLFVTWNDLIQLFRV